MSNLPRKGAIGIGLLVLLFSIPIWIPRLSSQDQRTAPEIDIGGSSDAFLPSSLPPMTIIDAGWIRGASTETEVLHPPEILRWNPGEDRIVWRHEIGAMAELHLDENELYLVEPDRLTILDKRSGVVLAQGAFGEAPSAGPNVRSPLPITRQSNRLYLRNNAWRNNLFILDLESQTIGENSWDLCERGTPWDTKYLPRRQTFLTFCLDLSTGMSALLTRLSIPDGSLDSMEMPTLGGEDYMVGNGLAIAPGGMAYVVDSDAGAVAEVDPDTLRILRVAHYRSQPEQARWLERGLASLADLAAKTAYAKRWMSQPAISPDRRHLIVDGGFGIGGGSTTTAWLIDLENLESVAKIDLPISPQSFQFVNDTLLYILLQTDLPGNSRLMVIDIKTHETVTLDLPNLGRAIQVLP